MRTGRRGFLLGATGTLASLSHPLRAAGREVDVAIVGAGLAGLHCALLLAELGAHVVVLEADRRPGGRVLTADGWFGAPDLGGVQIGPAYARIRDLCNRLGVALGPGAHLNAPYSFVLEGQLIPPKAWPDSPLNRLEGAERHIAPHVLGSFYVEQRVPFTRLDEWLDPAAAQWDLSLAEWLAREGASEEAKRLIRVTQGGTRPEDLSVLRMFQEATRSKLDLDRARQEASASGKDAGASSKDNYERGGLISSHVIGGTSRLIEAMARSLGDRVRLGHEVRAIETAAGGCRVRCVNGREIRARHVVVAVPFSVLRRIAITPRLEGPQADAIARMPYGNQSQVWLRVKRPYWEQDGVEASMWTDGPFTLIRQQIEPDGSRTLVSALSFGPNSAKVDAMTPAERGRYALSEIERIRPAARGALEVIGVHSWAQSAFIGGCSHQYVPHFVGPWAHADAEPRGRLHFAGEHLRRFEVGMEAAAESGERAALEVGRSLDA